MHLSHIPQYVAILNKNVHIYMLNGALWDTGQICEIALVYKLFAFLCLLCLSTDCNIFMGSLCGHCGSHGSHLLIWFNLSDYIHNKMWHEITYLWRESSRSPMDSLREGLVRRNLVLFHSQTSTAAAVAEVWEWLNNFTPHLYLRMVTWTVPGLKLIHVN